MYATPATGSSQNPNDLEDYLLGKKRVDKILIGDENEKVNSTTSHNSEPSHILPRSVPLIRTLSPFRMQIQRATLQPKSARTLSWLSNNRKPLLMSRS